MFQRLVALFTRRPATPPLPALHYLMESGRAEALRTHPDDRLARLRGCVGVRGAFTAALADELYRLMPEAQRAEFRAECGSRLLFGGVARPIVERAPARPLTLAETSW